LGFRYFCESRYRAAVKDLTALLRGAWSDINYPIRVQHYIEFMLYDKKRVSRSLKRSRARSNASVSAGWSLADGSSNTDTTGTGWI
jgi:hypothetical protein